MQYGRVIKWVSGLVSLAAISTSVAWADGNDTHAPALMIDESQHWTLESDGFRSASRFFRNGVFGTAFEESLVVDEHGFGVGFQDPKGKGMRSVRRDYQLISHYMIVAPVDRETTSMIGRKHDVAADWDGDCIRTEFGTMTARSCFEHLTITWPDDTFRFMLLEDWTAFAQALCNAGTYERVSGICPKEVGAFDITLRPLSRDRSFRELRLSSEDGSSAFRLSHNIRPNGYDASEIRMVRKYSDGTVEELDLADKNAILEALN